MDESRRFCLPPSRVGNRPGERVGDLARDGTDVLLICGSEEFRPFLETGISADRRPEIEGRLRIEVIPALEHSLLNWKDRDKVAAMMLTHVLSRFRQAPAR